MTTSNAPTGLGHNNPPEGIDGLDEFVVDYARALHWAAMQSDLDPQLRHLVHCIACLMPKDGSGCWPSYRWMAEVSGIPLGTIKRNAPLLRQWAKLEIESGRGRRGNVYKTNISKEEAIAEWCRKKRVEEKLTAVAVAPGETTRQRTVSLDETINVGADAAGETTNPSGRTSQPVAVSPEPVAVSQGPVVVSPGDPLLLDSRDSMHGRTVAVSNEGTMVYETSGADDNVHPLHRELAAEVKIINVYGRTVNSMVQNIIEWFDLTVEDAVKKLAADVVAFGSLNVFEVWQEASTKAKTPPGYYTKVLKVRAQENGKRDMPVKRETDYMSPAEACRRHHGKGGF